MRSVTPTDMSGLCPRCYLKLHACLCADLPRVITSTEIVIIRHITERHLTSNTGRLLGLMLPRASLIEYAPAATAATTLLSPDLLADSWLLYPSGEPRRPHAGVPRRLLVVDATFRRAKRMLRRLPALYPLPRLSLGAPSAPIHRLRVPTRADGMSTLEAVAHALTLLEGESVGLPLLAAYAEFVRRVDRIRGRLRAPLDGG